MNATTRPTQLREIGQRLQQDFQEAFPQQTQLQVACDIQKQTFVVLAQHPPTENLQVPQAFGRLEQTLKQLYTEEIFPQGRFPTRVYLALRVTGDKKPYVAHQFDLETAQVAGVADADSEGSELSAPDASEFSAMNSEELFANATTDNQHSSFSDRPSNANSGNWHQELEGIDNPFDVPASSSSRSRIYMGSHASKTGGGQNRRSSGQSYRKSSRKSYARSSSSELSLGTLVKAIALAGGSLTLMAGLAYGLSRPCVIGKCVVLQEAKQFSNQLPESLANATSAQEIIGWQQQLQKHIRQVKAIPPWSWQHGRAQDWLAANQEASAEFARLQDAFRKATQAAQLSQNPPHSVERWQEVAAKWKQAIADLESVPQDASFADLVAEKREEYRHNLRAIRAEIRAEQEAQEQLDDAKAAVATAQTREGVAGSWESWQRVYSSWQRAIERLQQVPSGTQAYQEAQSLLASYKSELGQARDRKNQEAMAAKLQNQAMNAAQQAKELEQKGNWSEAVSSWRNAIRSAQQLQQHAGYGSKAQTLAQTYQTELQTAQKKLQTAQLLQQARSSLMSICMGSPKICEYNASADVISVRLASNYVQRVRTTVMEANSNDRKQILSQVDSHVRGLQAALEGISDSVGIPIAVYDPFGGLIDTYNPNKQQ
jgi:hypothetical protein